MPRKWKVNPFDDYEVEYSLEELIEMYISEGKSLEEAIALTGPVEKFLHADRERQQRSWAKSKWERLRREEEE